MAIEPIFEFVIRFQNLQSQLTWLPTEDEARETFLAALREPMRTTLTMLDFMGQTTDNVIDTEKRAEAC